MKQWGEENIEDEMDNMAREETKLRENKTPKKWGEMRGDKDFSIQYKHASPWKF